MTAFLIGEEGPLSGLVVRFQEGDEWVLGRDPDISGQILEDPMVSRRHVICRLTPEGYLLENLSSVNPATQNGKVITEPVLLRESDIIQIGSTFFRFTEKEPVSEFASDIEPLSTEEEDLSSFDLPPPSEERWMLKVISGPNTGGEFSIQPNHTYIIGKDPTVSDIVFQDLSVSRQHARLSCTDAGVVSIEDLGSRNGVLINGELIIDRRDLSSQDLIALGTTSFLIIDRFDTKETIYSPPPFPAAVSPSHEGGMAASAKFEEGKEGQTESALVQDWKEMVIPKRHIVLAAGFGCLILIVLISLFSLFASNPIKVDEKPPTDLIKNELKSFPGVQFSFNPASGKLFLIGHVLTAVDHQELLYLIKTLPMVRSVEDNVVVDEYVWQNMNALLATNPDWKGISIHSPVPGRFVMRGYLQSLDQSQSLADYMNRQFPYLDLLDNQVVIEGNLNTQIEGMLVEKGYNGVSFQLSNGELVLSGRIDDKQGPAFSQLVDAFKALRGIRMVKNFVVLSTIDSSRVDLSDKYRITGASKKDGVSYSVVVNGKILGKGDLLDGMLITSIEPNIVFLEKDGSKFKINYNLQ